MRAAATARRQPFTPGLDQSQDTHVTETLRTRNKAGEGSVAHQRLCEVKHIILSHAIYVLKAIQSRALSHGSTMQPQPEPPSPSKHVQ